MPDIRLVNIEFQAFGIKDKDAFRAFRERPKGARNRGAPRPRQIIAMPPLT
jgi:hypothetical protein